MWKGVPSSVLIPETFIWHQGIQTTEADGLGFAALTRMMAWSLPLRLSPLHHHPTKSDSTMGSSENLGIQQMVVGEPHWSWPRCCNWWVAEWSPESRSPDCSSILLHASVLNLSFSTIFLRPPLSLFFYKNLSCKGIIGVICATV